MGKKNKGKTKKNNALNVYTDDPKLALERMKANTEVRKAFDKLQSEVEEIRNKAPMPPPPPMRHEYQQEVWREADEPGEIWIKVTCPNCAFLLYAKVKDLQEKVQHASTLCALPFGTAAECEKIVKEWEQAVAKAYAEIMDRECKKLDDDLGFPVVDGYITPGEQARRMLEHGTQLTLDIEQHAKAHDFQGDPPTFGTRVDSGSGWSGHAGPDGTIISE